MQDDTLEPYRGHHMSSVMDAGQDYQEDRSYKVKFARSISPLSKAPHADAQLGPGKSFRSPDNRNSLVPLMPAERRHTEDTVFCTTE